MIKKWVVALVAMAMLMGVSTAAMAQAVNFKFGGWFRYRGIAADNQDRLDTVPKSDIGRDRASFFDSVFRPYFIGTMEDKARVFFQLDIPSFNQIGGEDAFQVGTGFLPSSTLRQRTQVNVVVYNLQVKVPYIPGNWFVKIGRDNVFLPRGIIGRLPLLREFGVQVWGTLGIFKPRFEFYKRDETGLTAAFNRGLDSADDDDVYILKLPFTPMKGVRIMPYLTIWEQNRTNNTGATVRQYYPAIEASARYKMFTGKLDFIYQTGDIDFNLADEANGNKDKDVSAFVLWLQGGVTLGPANVSLNYVLASGDSDQLDGDENQFFAVGCSPITGDTGCDARAQGPTDLWFGDKYSDIFTAGSRNLGGNTGGTGGRYARGNGVQVVSLDASYRLRKNILLQATAAGIWSYFKRPDLTTDGSTPFVDDKFIGTEVDFSATWTIYKGVSLHGGIDYLFAGDYGELKNKIALDQQVPGGSNRKVNENDDTWQAVWRLQWAF